MKEKENIQKSEQKPKKSFKDINEFHGFWNKQRMGARQLAQEQSKRSVSLEEARAQTRRIQGS